MDASDFSAVRPRGQEAASGSAAGSGSWFVAVAEAWGAALDEQAGKLVSLSERVAGSDDQPSTAALLSAEAMRMNFLSNSEHTTLDSIGKGLETLSRKG